MDSRNKSNLSRSIFIQIYTGWKAGPKKEKYEINEAAFCFYCRAIFLPRPRLNAFRPEKLGR